MAEPVICQNVAHDDEPWRPMARWTGESNRRRPETYCTECLLWRIAQLAVERPFTIVRLRRA